MKGVSEDYAVRVKNVPTAVWFVGTEDAKALSYFRNADKIPPSAPGKLVLMAGQSSMLLPMRKNRRRGSR